MKHFLNMSSKEQGYFQHNGNSCDTTIQDDCLILKALPQNGTPTSVHTIPLWEVLCVKHVRLDDLSEKRTLGLKRKAKQPCVLIRTVKRYKDRRWRLTSVKLKSEDELLCQKWTEILAKKLTEFQHHRPKFLLVFVNPYGGNGTAESIYNKKVKPIFDEAQIKTQVIKTSFRHHAKTFIETNTISDYDGIIAVGGDGMLNEVVNGLLTQTQSRNGIDSNTKKGEPRSCSKFLRPDLRVGVIPAGSTDCVSYVTQGINDAETSALHIVLGDSHPVDVVSLHNSDGIFQQFSMSMTGYGYFGDLLRHSENYRWMGPPRYTFVGANVFMRNKSYPGEVHYLPVDATEDPTSSSFCRTPCSICQDGLADTETRLFTPITPNTSFTDGFTMDSSSVEGDSSSENVPQNSIVEKNPTSREEKFLGIVNNKDNHLQSANDTSTTVVTDGNMNPSTEEIQDILLGLEDEVEASNEQDIPTPPEQVEAEETFESSRSEDLVISGIPKSEEVVPPPTRPGSLSLVQPQEQEEEEEDWKIIRGDFISIKGVAMSCACEKSPLGISPYSHLSDGAIDLIVVRSCSRYEFLRYMIALSGKSDRFDFPYVEVHRVKAFQFIPSAPSSPQPQNFETTTPARVPTPGSITTTDTSCSESVHISLDDLSVKYHPNNKKNKKKRRSRGLKRSQSMVTNRASTWNSDGEIVSDPNVTVRVHRGLILMFCRGVEEINQSK